MPYCYSSFHVYLCVGTRGTDGSNSERQKCIPQGQYLRIVILCELEYV